MAKKLSRNQKGLPFHRVRENMRSCCCFLKQKWIGRAIKAPVQYTKSPQGMKVEGDLPLGIGEFYIARYPKKEIME